MYKKLPLSETGIETSVQRIADNACIPFDPANTDYQRFKTEIKAGEAELQDSEGVTMSPEEAKQFVSTLP